MSSDSVQLSSLRFRSTSGVALVIILAFIVLLTGVVVAFFSRAISERQVSNSSASQTRSEVFAQGAVDQVIGDLRQEIAAGSDSTTPAAGVTIYNPKSPATAIPALVGSTGDGGFENLVKRSVNGATSSFFPASPSYDPAFPPSNRAAAVSTLTKSQNGRNVSPARWNLPLLLPKANLTSDTVLTPFGATEATATAAATWANAPDWILVPRDASDTHSLISPPSSTSNNAIIGRYAYNIYDEGGLLDMNVAGSPSSTNIASGNAEKTYPVYKSAMAFADLTQLKDVNGPLLTQAQIDQIIGWRNYASAASPTLGIFPIYTWNEVATKNYYKSILTNSKGFLAPPNSTIPPTQTDKFFSSRQQLIDLISQGVATPATRATLQNALQYLGTFTRGLDQPSFAPNAARPRVLRANQGGNSAFGNDDFINPSFLSVRAQGGFRRADGSTAVANTEPLVKKRFVLNRLAWLTFEGPSSLASTATKAGLLSAGISQSIIDAGTAANIETYFGLRWDSNVWKYNVHNLGGPIKKLQDIAVLGAAGREPDFFELLKATIHVGSLGKASTNSKTEILTTGPKYPATPNGTTQANVPANYRYDRDSSVDIQVLQIGANIIDQFDADAYPTKITCDLGGSLIAQDILGVESLPYLNYLFNGVVQVESASSGPPGVGVLLQVPALWNPHDPNASYGNPRPTQFRVLADSAPPDLVGTGGVPNNDYSKLYSYGYSGKYSYDANPRPDSSRYHIDYTRTGNPISEVITFIDPINTTTGSTFREPTCLVSRSSSVQANNPGRPAGFDSFVAGALTGTTLNNFVGFDLGHFPLKFKAGTDQETFEARISNASGAANRFFLTYRVQYQNPSGQWITYDTKYARATNGRHPFYYNRGNSVIDNQANASYACWMWAAAFDPRSSRFGMLAANTQQGVDQSATYPPPLGDGISSRYNGQWINLSEYQVPSQRSDRQSGFIMVDHRDGKDLSAGDLSEYTILSDIPLPLPGSGWRTTGFEFFNTKQAISLGMLTQNNPTIPYVTGRYTDDTNFSGRLGKAINPVYYADPDGVVRRAMGAYIPNGFPSSSSSGPDPKGPSDGTIGVPSARINAYTPGKTALPYLQTDKAADTNQAQSRPYFLNRPFRSVAELGYVFRDDPWRNIDFFTPESGDAALLDVFCISELENTDSMVAGRINLNTRQIPVLAAIISGAYVDDPKISNTTIGQLSPTAANVLATALVARTKDLVTAGKGPITNLKQLAGDWKNSVAIVHPASDYDGGRHAQPALASPYSNGALSYAGFSSDLGDVYDTITGASTNLKQSLTRIQRLHEAPVRALSSVGQTRVWNLMVDLIAQTGKYPIGSTSLSNFTVDGEKRLWVHLAIDRSTGKVIDKSIETVNE